jgi:hypothetical protein
VPLPTGLKSLNGGFSEQVIYEDDVNMEVVNLSLNFQSEKIQSKA